MIKIEHFDIIIPTIKRDIYKIKENLDIIRENIDFDNIYFIGNKEVEQEVAKLSKKFNFVKYIDEDNIIKELNLSKIKNILIERINDSKRAGWYFQQFIKLSYSKICNNSYYVTWDSDTIPLKKVTMFSEEGKPYFDLKTEYHRPYFDTIRILFGSEYNKNLRGSYISEHMVFKTDFVKELIKQIESNNALKGNDWIEKIMYCIDEKELPLSGFSEFETYGTWVNTKYSNFYQERKWKSLRNGDVFYKFPLKNTKELKRLSKYYDAISFEKENRGTKEHIRTLLPLNLYFSLMSYILAKKKSFKNRGK